MPRFDLDLAESRRGGGDANVGREQELDADREARALNREDDGLLTRAREAQRIDAALGDVPRTRGERRAPLR